MEITWQEIKRELKLGEVVLFCDNDKYLIIEQDKKYNLLNLETHQVVLKEWARSLLHIKSELQFNSHEKRMRYIVDYDTYKYNY